jgi:hypothetical protein
MSPFSTLLFACVVAAGTLPNSVIVGISEAVPNSITGTVYEAYQPYLDVINGCVPSPAVDVNGNTKLAFTFPSFFTSFSLSFVLLFEFANVGGKDGCFEGYTRWGARDCYFPPFLIEANGYSEGLPLTGAQDSGCNSNLGQIYVRGAEARGMFGVMYAWYMPKDEPAAGLGHVNDVSKHQTFSCYALTDI